MNTPKGRNEYIPYGLDRYEQHYFYNDYENLSARFKETAGEADNRRRDARHAKVAKDQEVREFVPYKVAVRIQDTISFSTRLDARDDALRLSKKTLKELDARDAAIAAHSRHRQFSIKTLEEGKSHDIKAAADIATEE